MEGESAGIISVIEGGGGGIISKQAKANGSSTNKLFFVLSEDRPSYR